MHGRCSSEIVVLVYHLENNDTNKMAPVHSMSATSGSSILLPGLQQVLFGLYCRMAPADMYVQVKQPLKLHDTMAQRGHVSYI